MAQMKTAMEQAQQLESQLANERIAIERGPVKALFDGTGLMLSIKIDPAAVDPEDVETLEDVVLSAVRSGFEQATEARNAKVQGILPNVPDFGL